MRVDMMRVPYHSNLFPDPPSDFFNMSRRANRAYDNVVREIPVHYEPFSSNSFDREYRTSQNGLLFDNFVTDMPEDFWEPVTTEEAERLRKNSRKSPKRNTSQKVAVVDLCDDGDEDCGVLTCDANNSGASIKSRRRSLSKSRKRFAYAHDETSTPSTTITAGPSRHGGNEGKVDNRVIRNVEKDLQEASVFKPTLEKKGKQDERETECIEVDSLEEERQLQNLCDFFGCDSNINTPNKSSENDVNISTPPSYPAYDIIKAILDKEGRCVDYIRGDGNCFFRAISKVIYGSETCHSELRQAVVDLLEKYPREFEQFVDGSVHEHIKSMRKLGTWATQTEIYVAATLIQREIYVLSPDHTGDVYRWLLFSPQFVYKEASVYDPCYLTLCHTNGNHYDRIVAVDKKCNCDVSPPQMMGVHGEVDLTDDIV